MEQTRKDILFCTHSSILKSFLKCHKCSNRNSLTRTERPNTQWQLTVVWHSTLHTNTQSIALDKMKKKLERAQSFNRHSQRQIAMSFCLSFHFFHIFSLVQFYFFYLSNHAPFRVLKFYMMMYVWLCVLRAIR